MGGLLLGLFERSLPYSSLALDDSGSDDKAEYAYWSLGVTGGSTVTDVYDVVDVWPACAISDVVGESSLSVWSVGVEVSSAEVDSVH